MVIMLQFSGLQPFLDACADFYAHNVWYRASKTGFFITVLVPVI